MEESLLPLRHLGRESPLSELLGERCGFGRELIEVSERILRPWLVGEFAEIGSDRLLPLRHLLQLLLHGLLTELERHQLPGLVHEVTLLLRELLELLSHVPRLAFSLLTHPFRAGDGRERELVEVSDRLTGLCMRRGRGAPAGLHRLDGLLDGLHRSPHLC